MRPCHDWILCRTRWRPRYARLLTYLHSRTFLTGRSFTVSDLVLVPERLLDELTRSNKNIGGAVTYDTFLKPTIRLVRSGTFSAFRQLKLDEGSSSLGQVKVPVVLPKPEYVTWFSNRVVQEL